MGKGRIAQIMKFLAAPAKMAALQGFAPARSDCHDPNATGKPPLRSHETIRIGEKIDLRGNSQLCLRRPSVNLAICPHIC
jgi:hypothetical protein